MVRRILLLCLTCVLLSASVIDATGQALPEDARAVLRQTITQLQVLADRYQQSGQAASASAVLNQIRSLQLTLTQSVPVARMNAYRSRVGETFRVRVTGSAASGRGIWGTDVYTDDSDLALAAVHAGLLAADQEGEVVITFLPGQSQYQGSTRNGVITSNFDGFPGSYRVGPVDARSATLPVLPPPPPPQASQLQFFTSVTGAIGAGTVSFFNFVGPSGPFLLDEQGMWRALGGQLSDGRAVDESVLMALRGRNGESFEYEVTGAMSGEIWGDGVYTDDSDLPVTAVHAGVLRPGERGRVRITVLPGRPRYEGISRNGVLSHRYDSWEGSYRVEVPQQASAAATATASVAGRITDANKRPVRNAGVTATGPRTYSAATNAEGDYVLNGMLPGAYLLTVSPGQSQSIVPGPAYFPAGTARDTASRVPVQAGQPIVGIDIVLESPKVFKVSGKVSNPPAGGVRRFTAVPRITPPAPAFDALLMTNTSPNASQGEFELMLPAGAWDIFPVVPTLTQPTPMPSSGTAVYSSGRAPVTISDRNVEGLSVSLTSADITGRIAIDSRLTRPAGFSLSSVEVQLEAVDGTPAPLWYPMRATKVTEDGVFTIRSIPPGEYRLHASSTVAGVSFSDARTVRVGGQSIDPVLISITALPGQ